MGYLIFAVVLSAALAWLVVWLQRRPKSMEQSIVEFSRGLDALAPKAGAPNDGAPNGRRGRGAGGTSPAEAGDPGR